MFAGCAITCVNGVMRRGRRAHTDHAARLDGCVSVVPVRRRCAERDWRVVAPDWRGFGLTDRAPADCYWYPDYLADLEFMLDDVVGSEPA